MGTEDVVDLGWMNGWSKDRPQQYRDCVSAGHIPSVIVSGWRGTVETCTCNKCGIQWKIDSGD